MPLVNELEAELEDAARSGDINRLYTVIQKNPHVLKRVDDIPFVDTPLHVAASAGHAPFATEIMTLKPSFARKLNQQGLSPIHLALQHGHKDMVLRFVEMDKDLVRVKGREGLTPLHFVTQNGDIDLLGDFLEACPDCIKDETVRRETALHIAVKSAKLEALQLLVDWLSSSTSEVTVRSEYSILNRKDESGNTITHIAVSNGDKQALDILLNKEVWMYLDLEARNSQNSTALDIAATANREEIRRKLLKAGAERGSSVKDHPTLAERLRKYQKNCPTLVRLIGTHILRFLSTISEKDREAYLVVATLIVTALYQTALSPPGGVYQADSGGNNNNLKAHWPFNFEITSGSIGKSVMEPLYFFSIAVSNTFALVLTILIIFIVMPTGWIGFLLVLPMLFLASSYVSALLVISPTRAAKSFNVAAGVILGMLSLMWAVLSVFLLRRLRLPPGLVIKKIKMSLFKKTARGDRDAA